MQAKQYLWTPQGDWTPHHPARANVRLAHADNDSAHSGSYSYRELCPFRPGRPRELHNQTMTVTTFSEH